MACGGRRAAFVLVSAGLFATSCSSPAPAETEAIRPLGVERCVVWLHGKSERGRSSVVVRDVGEISPTGNGRAGDGHEWRYSPEAKYQEAVGIVADAVEGSGCRRIVISGFSNGGAFAGKLYCRGETFGGRLAGVVVDDPPPDTGTQECAPDPDVEVALYWTGALDGVAEAGVDCGDIGYTCDGDNLVGIHAYAEALGTEILSSPFREHVWHREAPELDRWLPAAD